MASLGSDDSLAADDVALLDRIQREAFGYFLTHVNPANGLVADKSRAGWPASIAATGMALAAYPVAVDRGLMTRAAAVAITLTTLRFFHDSRQGTAPDATGYRGFYYHFLDMTTGQRAWRCELSTVDTGLLLAGALTAAAYFDAPDDNEQQIRTLADTLYRRVDWRWALNGAATLTHGYKPRRGFLPYRWRGYDEALLLYVLALGSPTSPVPVDSYAAWLASYEWTTIYGHEFVYAGPLFIHQLSHLWIDFRGVQDACMRDRGLDYFENSRRATLVQREYATRNPRQFAHYGRTCWGLSASDGPGPAAMTVDGVRRRFFDYVARGAPYGPDDGTVAPWAVVASLPFAPEVVMPAIRDFAGRSHLREPATGGCMATVNPTWPGASEHGVGWVSPWQFGIQQGPIVVMIENHRSEFVWRLMRRCPHIVDGLRRAGFRGGWL